MLIIGEPLSVSAGKVHIEGQPVRLVLANAKEVELTVRVGAKNDAAAVAFEDSHLYLKGEVAEAGAGIGAIVEIICLCDLDMVGSISKVADAPIAAWCRIHLPHRGSGLSEGVIEY